MIVSLIAALGRNLVIGNATGMPWHVPHDLKRFRSLTLGKPILMGRRTFEILGRPLPGRPNIILTHDTGYRPEGVHVAHSPHAALGVAERLLRESKGNEVMVIGGEQVYRTFAGWAQRLYLSRIEGDYQGTAYFPDRLPGLGSWHLVRREDCPIGDGCPVPYTFFQWERPEPGKDQPTAALLGS